MTYQALSGVLPTVPQVCCEDVFGLRSEKIGLLWSGGQHGHFVSIFLRSGTCSWDLFDACFVHRYWRSASICSRQSTQKDRSRVPLPLLSASNGPHSCVPSSKNTFCPTARQISCDENRWRESPTRAPFEIERPTSARVSLTSCNNLQGTSISSIETSWQRRNEMR